MVDVYLYPVTIPAGADVWLRDPTSIGAPATELSPDPVLLALAIATPWLVQGAPPPGYEAHDALPPNYAIPNGVKARSLYVDLLKRYGTVEGARIYAKMQAEAKGPFAPGRKYHDAHTDWAAGAGVAPIEDRASGRRRGRGPRSR